MRSRKPARNKRPEAVPAPSLKLVRNETRALADPEDARFLQGFFKTGPGQYGEGDLFLGIRVPALRSLARAFRGLPLSDALKLLRSKWHEERLLALLILQEQHRRGMEEARRRIHRLYLANTRYVNNWDLVDVSAPQLVGEHVNSADLALLERLAASRSLWERRVAMLATLQGIRNGSHEPALRIARVLRDDTHDLIHKAVGWMLREIGKRDLAAERAFLDAHHRQMPRTMLRYAIERFPETERKAYLAGRA